ncbi:MAG: diguanylate cyclase [Burkholderiaceae bacterium]
MPRTKRASTAKGARLARKSWQLLHLDSARAITLAREALEVATRGVDLAGQAWARLAIGYHLLDFGTPQEAAHELGLARDLCQHLHDDAGRILAIAGLARCLWREGRFAESLEQVLPLRDEGLAVLQHGQRGVLLDTIAGCYSAQGHSDQAFAYMYQALRDSGPAHGRGYDAVLHCNLGHELLQIGDCHEALRQLNQGISRCLGIRNPRLLAVLLINRVICLTELDRAQEAMLDVMRVRSLPADAGGRGMLGAHFETLAITALRAGEHALGAELVQRAIDAPRASIADEHVELAIAQALLAGQRRQWLQALQALDGALHLVGADEADAAEGLSLRVRCQYFALRSELQEQLGDPAAALATLRVWQQLHTARAQMASRARYQAAALQTELLRLQHKLDEHEAQRRVTERARAELEAVNRELSRRIQEVQSLQEALRQQATHDALTGLFNRRYFNDTLPSVFGRAMRHQEPLAVAVIDLDHFKAVNDRHGHLAGDSLLAAFGRLMAEHCRHSDIACRYGGEEFCLLMPRTDAATAQRKVHALLAMWRDQVFTLNGHTVSGLSFSAGVADSRRAPIAAQLLLRAADEQLLQAKRMGRGRVMVEGEDAMLPF